MGVFPVIVGLAALSILVFVVTRRRVIVGDGRGGRPMSWWRVALVIAIGATLVAVSLQLLSGVWLAFFPTCCNP